MPFGGTISDDPMDENFIFLIADSQTDESAPMGLDATTRGVSPGSTRKGFYQPYPLRRCSMDDKNCARDVRCCSLSNNS